jgi:hypothetical protein
MILLSLFYPLFFVLCLALKKRIRPVASFVDDMTCGATNDSITVESKLMDDQELIESETKLVELMEEIIQYFSTCYK